MTRLDCLNYGAPITPTRSEWRRAYSRVGALVPRIKWPTPKPVFTLQVEDDLDPARGVIRAAVASFLAFAVFAWVLS